MKKKSLSILKICQSLLRGGEAKKGEGTIHILLKEFWVFLILIPLGKLNFL